MARRLRALLATAARTRRPPPSLPSEACRICGPARPGPDLEARPAAAPRQRRALRRARLWARWGKCLPDEVGLHAALTAFRSRSSSTVRRKQRSDFRAGVCHECGKSMPAERDELDAFAVNFHKMREDMGI